ncbi:MAG: response regulator [Stenotrophomonas sp.]|uniref:response regulator n=1 Tax=Stenotrophomonas sp. TaxID=69392 RepID=UPI003D6D2C38
MKTTIAIADDHPIVLAGIREMIDRDRRFKLVGQAQSPEGLVGLMQAHAPDIVVTDYNMPGDGTVGDGLKLISYLSQNYQACRMLILTMVSNPSIIAAMYRKGASGVLLKSGDPREFHAALSSLLDQCVYRSPVLSAGLGLPQSAPTPRAPTLSPREFEVIRLFAGGHSVSSIAKNLSRSSKTVSTQKVSAMRKLGTSSDQELIAYCLQSELFL